jgi:hypothetical protein
MMQEPLFTSEPMGWLAHMAAERGMHDRFAAPATAAEAELQSAVGTVVWRSRASRALRGLADRIEPATIPVKGHPAV